jgi:GntR family transcriptional regulator
MPENRSAPKYIHIKEELLAGIASQRFTRMLPSENRLAKMFAVSRMTARKALEEVEKAGFAVRVPGKGTFVKDRQFNQGYFRIQPSHKHAQELKVSHSTQVLELRVLPPPARVAEKLDRPETVILVRRLHLFDDTPVRYEVRYLHGGLCADILQENLEVDSIHEILVYKYRLPLTRVWQRMNAVGLSEEIAYLFDVDPGYPAFHIQRITYTLDKPVTWVEYFIRGELAFEDSFSPQREAHTGGALSY